MIFENSILNLKGVQDRLVEAILQKASQRTQTIIRPSDILAAAIDCRDQCIIDTLTLALDNGCAPSDVKEIIEVYNPSQEITRRSSHLRRDDFSSSTLEALDQFGHELQANQQVWHNHASELLLACILAHLDDEDKEYLTLLNIERGMALFREHIQQTDNAQTPLFNITTGQLQAHNFSKQCWDVIKSAGAYAESLGYDHILPAHLFLALIDQNDITQRLIRLQLQPSMSLEHFSHNLAITLRTHQSQKHTITFSKDFFDASTCNILNIALKIAQTSRANIIDSPHILMALLEAMPPRLAMILEQSPFYIDYHKMLHRLPYYLDEERKTHQQSLPDLDALQLPVEDLTQLAQLQKFPTIIRATGPKTKINAKTFENHETIVRALYRQTKKHVLITGQKGVGKTTLIKDVAYRAAQGEYSFLKQKRFIWINCENIAAHESRAQLLHMFSIIKNIHDCIFCLDGIDALLRTEGQSTNISILRQAMQEKDIHLIGLLSQRDFEEVFAGEPDILDTFTCVNVEEPNNETMSAILNQKCKEYEQEYGILIEEKAIERALFLSTNYILNEYLPKKAIDILRRACENLDYERTQLGSQATTITVPDIIQVVAQLSGLPEETLTGIAQKVDYAQTLGSFVVGQEHAVRIAAQELRRIKAGWTDPGKPATVLLFVGPTGVGKTELAKALAQFYSTSKRLRTYAMGNFTEPHSVSGIIGSPPGYIGHEQGGNLINDLNADPYGVFLFDEAEKAHPEVWKPFLNLFDEAWITDARGVKAFADKAIFILTTNAGAKTVSGMWEAGERDYDNIKAHIKAVLTRPHSERDNQPLFPPEFLARIKDIIIFHPLDQQAMEDICRKHIAKMQRIWREKQDKELLVSDELIHYIAERGHEGNQRSKNKEGGRIISKLITELIESTLLDEQLEREEDYHQAQRIELLLREDTTSAPVTQVLFHPYP